MIILCLILSVLAFSYFNILGTKKWEKGAMVLFGGLFLLSLVVVVANDRKYFGMEQQTKVTKMPLISSEPGKNEVLTYQAVGKKGEKVYLYRTRKNPEKLNQTSKLNVENKISYMNAEAVLEKKEVIWNYKNNFYQYFFAIAKNNHQVVYEANHFKLTDKWTSQKIQVPTKSKIKK